LPATRRGWRRCATVGVIGVELFLTISGFIITHMMVREEQRSGRLNLRYFWARRALRILPPLAAMMAGFAVAAAAGVFHWSWPSFFSALTFTRNLPIFGTDWFFGHTWSLSIEEQFYAIWPLLFVGLRVRRNLARGLFGSLSWRRWSRWFANSTGLRSATCCRSCLTRGSAAYWRC